MTRILTIFCCLSLSGCVDDVISKDSKSSKKDPTTEIVDAMRLSDFCNSIGFLKIEDAGVKEDLGLLCKDNQATALVTTLIANAWDGVAPLTDFPFKKNDENADEKSTFLVGFATKIPKLTPLQIRSSDLNNALLIKENNDFYSLNIEKKSENPGDGLNYLKLTTHAKMLVRAPQSKEFTNERDMEINMFQVSSMRDDLALRTEHLLNNESNIEYDWARTVVVIIGNPKEAGSYLLTLVNYRTWNHGFPKINMRALDQATKHIAQVTFNYLSEQAKVSP